MRTPRNPYRTGNAKRKAALAWLAERGITQPRPLYPPVLAEPVTTRRRLAVVGVR